MTQKEKWREKNSVILLKALKLQNELNQKHAISTLLLRTHEILFCIIIFLSIPCHFHQHKNIFKITHLKKEERKNPHWPDSFSRYFFFCIKTLKITVTILFLEYLFQPVIIRHFFKNTKHKNSLLKSSITSIVLSPVIEFNVIIISISINGHSFIRELFYPLGFGDILSCFLFYQAQWVHSFSFLYLFSFTFLTTHLCIFYGLDLILFSLHIWFSRLWL